MGVGEGVVVPTNAVPGTDLQLSLLSSTSLLTSALSCTCWLGAWSHQVPSGVLWQIGSLVHVAFQQAVWLPVPFGCLVEYSDLWFSLPVSFTNTIPPAFWILEICWIFHPPMNPQLPFPFVTRGFCSPSLPYLIIILHRFSPFWLRSNDSSFANRKQ